MGDEPRDRRLDFRSVEPHLQFLPFGVAALAVGFGDAERIVGGGQLGLRGLQRRFTLLDRRDGHHAAAELLRASKIVARPLRLRFRLGDRAARLLDRCVRAFDGRVVLSEQRVELGSIEAREDLAGLDPIAVLGVEFDDGKPVDTCADHRLIARHQSSGNKQTIHEFASFGRRDADCGGRRSGRLLGCGGFCRARRRLVRGEFCEERRRQRARRESACSPDAPERRERDGGDDEQGAPHLRDLLA